MIRNQYSIFAIVIISLCLSSCRTATFEYPPQQSQPFKSAGDPLDITIAVVPFEDTRETENREFTFDMQYLPLVPFGFTRLERPELSNRFTTISKFDSEPLDQFGRAAAYALEQAGLATKVYYAADGNTDGADFILQGKLRRIQYTARSITYGVSGIGKLFWLFGLPAGTAQNDVKFILDLVDPNGKIQWSYTHRAVQKQWLGLYYNYGKDMALFPSLTELGMNEGFKNLERAFPQVLTTQEDF